MPVDISMLGSLASISGLSLRTILKGSATAASNRQIIKRMSKYLALLDRDDGDPLAGMWTLQKWEFDAERFDARFVSGCLAVLYAKEPRSKWQCKMFLEYRKHAHFMLLSGNSWLAHRVRQCLTGVYDVEFTRHANGEFRGSSSMIDSVPPRQVQDQGIFLDVSITTNGTLQGRFENTNSLGRANFVFHQRKRWKEYEMYFDV
jgi:hypothetical protein